MKIAACRNRHCLIFGLGWPSIAMDTSRRVYIYVGPWLITVTVNA